ncbi:MAG TPA: ABC-three component system protein [Pirellulales bacterium]|jgi:hypothetical protein|nr:ABC-three component system protein [Pirellulales bacterium]
MGAPKTQLLKRDRYGLLKAAELAAEMIGHYERARDGAHEIRVEATTEPIWDDVVVHRSAHTDKWQVKRQTSPLDVAEARAIVAAIIPTTTTTTPAPRSHLHLGFAKLVAVGRGKTPVFECRDLAALCDGARAPNLDHDAFALAHKDHAAFKFIVENVPKSTPAATIVAALEVLHVHELGSEEDLRRLANSHICDLFTNADEVVTQLHSWFLQHSDGLIRIDSTVLHAEVIDRHAKRDPARGRWVHFARSGSSRWEARGPLATADVVERYWSGSENVRVQIGCKPFFGEEMTGPLARLMIHRSGGSTAEAADVVDWQSTAGRLCGETLGLTTDVLPLACGSAPATHPHPPRTDVTTTELANTLSTAMDDHVWCAFVAAVPQQLHDERCAADVRAAALMLWDRWLAQLAERAQRANLVCSMLMTAHESTRPGFDASVRSGRLLIPDLARAAAIALVIGVGFEAGGTNVAIALDGRPHNLILDTLSAHLIALTMASHPGDRRPCRLADDPAEMLAEETGMAILAGVQASATELYGIARDAALPFNASATATENLLHRGPPVLVLTASPHLLAAMRQSVDAVKQHVFGQLQQMTADRNNKMKRAVAEAVANG